jgi:hypothetical protein
MITRRVFLFRSRESSRYSPRMPGLPDLILSATLGRLDETWLELRCYQGTVYLPLRLVSGMYGRHARVGEVVARLRCQHCQVGRGLVALEQHRPDWRQPADKVALTPGVSWFG